jgi:hypothetical protein
MAWVGVGVGWAALDGGVGCMPRGKLGHLRTGPKGKMVLELCKIVFDIYYEWFWLFWRWTLETLRAACQEESWATWGLGRKEKWSWSCVKLFLIYIMNGFDYFEDKL